MYVPLDYLGTDVHAVVHVRYRVSLRGATPWGEGVAVSPAAKKWVAGVASTFFAAVLAAIFIPIITKHTATADIKVVAFTHTQEVPYDTDPSAIIVVENDGTATAVDCLIYWSPGVNNVLGNPEQVSYGQFAVDGGKQFQATLTSPVSYRFTATTTSTATVECNNTSDADGQSEQVTVT